MVYGKEKFINCKPGVEWCWIMKATEKQKQKMKLYYERNKEKRKKQMQDYRNERKERFSNYKKEYYKKNKEYIKNKRKLYVVNNKEKVSEGNKEYWKKNKLKYLNVNRQRYKEWYLKKDNNKYREHKRIWERNKKNSDIGFAIKKRLRYRIWAAINGFRKKTYDPDFHIDYKPIINKLLSELPKDFKENRSQYHIDHIIALHKYDLTKQEELEKAFQPNNHQWLTIEDHKLKTQRERKD